MDIANTYRLLKEGKITKERFMYDVRKDPRIPTITSFTSFDDAIKILKNKSIIKESLDEKPFYLVDDTGEVIDSTMAVDEKSAKSYFANEYEGLLNSMSVIKAIENKTNLGKSADSSFDTDMEDYDNMHQSDGSFDDYNDGEFWESKEKPKSQLEVGIEVELEHTDDREIAKRIATDHLKEDPKYYDKLNKAGLEEEVRPGSLQKNHEYLWTGGAEYMVVTYIGRANQFPELKAGSSMGKGYLFRWPLEKGKEPRYFELSPAAIFRYIANDDEDPDEMLYESKKLDADRVNPYELQKGIEWETRYNTRPAPDWNSNMTGLALEIEKAKNRAIKNINKDPLHYTKIEAGEVAPQKEVKTTSDGMSKIKGVKKTVANTKISLGNKEKNKKKSAGVKEMKGSNKKVKGVEVMKGSNKKVKGAEVLKEENMFSRMYPKKKPEKSKYEDKIVRNERNDIIEATNQEGETFKVGEQVYPINMTGVNKVEGGFKIRGFVLSQGKIKATYYIGNYRGGEGTTLDYYDIDGLTKTEKINIKESHDRELELYYAQWGLTPEEVEANPDLLGPNGEIEGYELIPSAVKQYKQYKIKKYLTKKLKTELDQDLLNRAKQGKLVMNLAKGSREEKEAIRNKIPYSSY